MPSSGAMQVWGAATHNLKDVDVDVPLGGAACATGSRSSLIRARWSAATVL